MKKKHRLQREILVLLASRLVHHSPWLPRFAIKEHLRRQGFWFVDVRASWALDVLYGEGLINRTQVAGSPERGGHPAFHYAISLDGIDALCFSRRRST